MNDKVAKVCLQHGKGKSAISIHNVRTIIFARKAESRKDILSGNPRTFCHIMPSVMWHYYSTEEDSKNATQVQQLKNGRKYQKQVLVLCCLQKAKKLRSVHAAEK